MRCDCGVQLDSAMELMQGEGRGVIVYLRGHEGRGIGIGHTIRAYGLQEQGRDTVADHLALGLPAASRAYGIGPHTLVALRRPPIPLLPTPPAHHARQPS